MTCYWAGLLLIVAALFAGTDLGYASGDASRCIVTVKKVLLKNISGEWITVSTPEYEYSLLSDDVIFSCVNYKRVPRGKYVNFKLVLSEILKVSGRDGKNFTRGGGEITVGGTATKASKLPGEIKSFKVAAPTWSDSTEGLMIEHLNLDYEDTNDTMEIYPRRDFDRPFLIKEGSGIHLWMTINLNNTIYFMFPSSIRRGLPTENVMYFIPPKVIDDLTISVDAASRSAASDMIEWDF
ncbi:MAG: hypothetical protein COT00_03640 [Candidatus Omnitrophica bacterium CG07_land_8_20_14_0_80_50_8]|nr:MAG: hypothetical protein COT00_03640 [Candidatus Omnitrophica bacterium CG07_land_8_20_14_0_80_50_8]